ncbi:MAG: ATP-dependent zinc metalloprotease FtsH [Phycisphaerales bacterium]
MADSNDRKRKVPDEGDADGSSNGGGAGGNGKGPGGGGPGNLRPSRSLFGLLSVLMVGLVAFLLLTSITEQGQAVASWADFETLYKSGRITEGSVSVRDTAIYGLRKEGQIKGEEGPVFYRISGAREFWLKEVNDLTAGRFKDQPTSFWTQMLLSLLPIGIVLLVIWVLLFRGLRSAAGGAGGMLGNFGKSRHRVLMKEKTGVTFADVAGINEAKDEVEEIIQFLKSPKRFLKLGGRIPRGVLLIGEPGCGKTLLAKAIAGEADVPFFSISGSDFVEMFVGVGASRVRDLFKQAKDAAPCIIFLDEIDAVGRRRGGGFTTGGHDEREQTLNAILVEMDGFATGDGVIIVAATNRADVLDPALTRPGRFDRQITVPLPDVKGRLEILKVHAKSKKLGPDADLERMAKATPMFSGADLAAIMNEAAIAATLQNKDFIEQTDLEEARDKIKFGRARKSRVREADENKLTAYHEAGHAVLQVLLADADPLHKVTIIPRGNMGGTTFSLPEKDRMGYGLKWLQATMRVACGGRIAEHKAMGDMSSGAMGDIAQVTRIARTMVEEWGMSPRLGFIRYAGSDTREMFMPEKSYSDETARIIDEEVKRFADEAYVDADALLSREWDKVVAVAEGLLKYETLDAPDVHRLMRGESIGKPTISDLLAAEAKKSRDAATGPSAPPSRPASPDLPPGAMPSPA